MPRRPNPPWRFPGDDGYRSEHGSRSGSSSPHDGMSDISYDENGQPRFGGVGQGLPLDEHGRYIYSPVGTPIIAITSSPSPGATHQVKANHVVSPQNDDHTDTGLGIISGCTDNRPSLKRRLSNDDPTGDPLPRTPRRFGGSLTNTPARAKSMLFVEQPHARKRRRLQAPFDFSEGLRTSRMENLEVVRVEFQEIKAAQVKQTEVLLKILEVLRERNVKD